MAQLVTRKVAWTLALAAGTAVVLLIPVSLSAQDPVSRQEMFATAQLWKPTDVASMNLRTGDVGAGAFAPGETVRCDYVDRDLHGKSPKFRCRIPPDDEIKVKFGDDNGEVFAEVAATRLLWALGFGADRMYPVRVVCRGCPVAIGRAAGNGERIIEPATVERPFRTTPVAADTRGWSWSELDLVDEHAGGAPRAQRDALKLLAVFLQHTDTKPEQQRVICLEVPAGSNRCTRAFLMLNDVGLTFGRATLLNANAVSGMNYRAWAGTPVWKYATTCIGNLPKSLTGTLRDPVISEEGRQFLAALLTRLSDAQLHDLFAAARVEQRAAPAGIRGATARVEQWVEAFRQKRVAIVDRRCTNEWSTRAPALFTTGPNLWLQSWASPRLTTVMDAISLFGYTPFFVAAAMFLAFAVNIRAGASLLVLLVLTNVITDASKVVVSYPRPDAVEPQIAALGPAGPVAAPDDRVAMTPSLRLLSQDAIARIVRLQSTMDADNAYGFPSGHVSVTVAFLCGLVFLFRWRGAWVAALVWIPLMGLSRMYLGRHFLGDVIGGVAVGVVATMVVVRALNLQRLGVGRNRRVLTKTVATAAGCVLLAYVAAMPPMYEAGRLAGAVVALCLASRAPGAFDDAPAMVRIVRLGVAAICSGLAWWATLAALHANVSDPSPTQAFAIGGVRMVALMPGPMLLEGALRRMRRSPSSLRLGGRN
jgi:membrane-associated phospholipid phosphatase